MKKEEIKVEELKKVNGGAGIGGGNDRKDKTSEEKKDEWNNKWIPVGKPK